MNKYRIEYSNGEPEDNIDYGIFEASSEKEAIEAVVSHDATRRIYNIDTNIEQRHWGMTATLITDAPKPGSLEDMQELAKHIETAKEAFNTLEQLYESNLKELEQYKRSSGFGVTFKYYESNDFFVPIFADIIATKKGMEKPHSMTLNFNQEILAHWLTECNMALEKEEEDED